MDQTYKSAGVDIEAGEKTVDKIKGYAKSTFNKSVLADIGTVSYTHLTLPTSDLVKNSVDAGSLKKKKKIEGSAGENDK